LYISFIEEENKWLVTFGRLDRPDLAGPYALQGETFIQPSLSKWLVDNCVGKYKTEFFGSPGIDSFYTASIWFELERDVTLCSNYFSGISHD
jgi:hypothetical protein